MVDVRIKNTLHQSINDLSQRTGKTLAYMTFAGDRIKWVARTDSSIIYDARPSAMMTYSSSCSSMFDN